MDQGAAYRPRTAPAHGLRADTFGAPSSAAAGADLPVGRTNHRGRLGCVSALRRTIVHGSPAASMAPTASHAMGASAHH